MRAFVGKDAFTGGWDEDLNTTIIIFETLSIMCEVSEEDQLKAVPIMLKGDALSYYSSYAAKCGS